MMRSVLSVLLVACAVSAQDSSNRVDGVEEINASPLAAFENKDVTFSFALKCSTACFLNSGEGVLDRVAVRAALRTAFNTRSTAEQAKLLSVLSAEQPNYNWESFVAQTYFQMSSSLTDTAPSMYNSITFDRVVEDSHGTTPTVLTVNTNPRYTTDPLFWNVFLRITMSDIPEVIADDFEPVIVAAMANLGQSSGLLVDSVWVSTTAHFITDKFETVPGRGHKNGDLLVQLILGVACMLLLPILFTALAVSSQKAAQKKEAAIAMKDKDLVVLQRNVAVNEGYIQTYSEREDEIEAQHAKQKAALEERDEAEMTEKDVDWKNNA